MTRIAIALSWHECSSLGVAPDRIVAAVRHRVGLAHPDAELTVSVSSHARHDVVTCPDVAVRRDVEGCVRRAWASVPWSGGCSA